MHGRRERLNEERMLTIDVAGARVQAPRRMILESSLDTQCTEAARDGPFARGVQQCRAYTSAASGGPHIEIVDEATQAAILHAECHREDQMAKRLVVQLSEPDRP